MAGLIHRVIWVWPHWDKENHESKHRHAFVGIGWNHVNRPFSSKGKATCFCVNFTDTEEQSCLSFDYLHKKHQKTISADTCNITKSIIFEELHEKVALKLSKTSKWILRGENVILDIDEDYYGCDYAIYPLLAVGFNHDTIDPIFDLVSGIFCPKTLSVEKEADKILMKVISALRKQVNCSKHSNKSFCKIKPEEIFMRGFKSFSNTLFCDVINIHENFKKLTDFLRTLKYEKLQALQKVGFCLNTSLKSLNQYGTRKFVPCFGNNTPEKSVVLEHKPTLKEISNRTLLMSQFLDRLKMTPKLITVCRSVRDGYTPRKYFEIIEQDVFNTLRKRYKDLSFHYDDALLGGEKGWPYYHYNKY